jgi:hypothetical protein
MTTPQDIQNYEFYTNWDKVFPLLMSRTVTCMMTKLYRAELGDVGDNMDTVCPASLYVRSDVVTHFESLLHRIFKHHNKNRSLDVDPNTGKTSEDIFNGYDWLSSQLDDLDYMSDSENEDEEMHHELCLDLISEEEYIMGILGFSWAKDYKKMLFWFPSYGSLQWNSLIGRFLAEKLMPTCKWVVLYNPRHSTLSCTEHNHIFDMVAYTWDDKLFNISLGLPIDTTDNRSAELAHRIASVGIGSHKVYAKGVTY